MPFEIYRPQVTPQARLFVPSAEGTVGEALGRGLQEIGQAGGQALATRARNAEVQQERDWQAQQPQIAQAIAETQANSYQAIDDLKKNAPDDLAGYKDAVGGYWDQQEADLLKRFQGTRAQQYIGTRLAEIRGGGIADAIRDTAAAGIKVRGDAIQKTVDTEVNNTISNPGHYAAALANITATLDAQKGAVPDEWINEKRTEAEQNLTGAMLGGMIDRDPVQGKNAVESGAWDSKITPQQKVALLRNADAGIKEKEYQAEKAQREAEKAQSEQNAMRLSDLQIAISRGEAGYQDVEKAYGNGKGWLQPDDRARLTLALDARGEKDARAAAALSFVAGAKTGAYQVDPKNPDQMQAVNADYINQVKAWTTPAYDPVSGQTTQRTQQQVDDLTIDYVKKLGVVPEALQGQLRGQIRNGSNDQMAYAANMLEQFRQTNPALLDDFSQADIERAQSIADQQRAGVPVPQAVANTLEAQKLDKATADSRTQAYQDLTKPPTGTTRLAATKGEIQSGANTVWQRWVPFKTNPAIPDAMAGEYETLKKDAYLRTGDIDIAKKSALDALGRAWGQSSINGSPSWMKSPPENFYSAPPQYGLTPEQNTEWMKAQLVTEFTAGAVIDESGGPVKDRLTVVPSSQVGPDGRPLYQVMFKDSLGGIGPAVDASGRAMLWAPDWSKSPKKAELDKKAAADLDLYRTSRATGLTPQQLQSSGADQWIKTRSPDEQAAYAAWKARRQ